MTQNRRDILIMSHLDLITTAVTLFSAKHRNWAMTEDLRGAAVLGLVIASRRFEFDRGVFFKTYAEHYVHGAIKDYLRRNGCLSRSDRHFTVNCEQVRARLEQHLFREATDAELAEALGLSMEGYCQMVNRIWVYMNERSMAGQAETISEDSCQLIATLESFELAAHYLETLPGKERLAIALFYFSGIPQKNIATLLNLSASRISQLHSLGMAKLKLRFEKDDADVGPYSTSQG